MHVESASLFGDHVENSFFVFSHIHWPRIRFHFLGGQPMESMALFAAICLLAAIWYVAFDDLVFQVVTKASLLGARTLLVAPGLTTSNKDATTYPIAISTELLAYGWPAGGRCIHAFAHAAHAPLPFSHARGQALRL